MITLIVLGTFLFMALAIGIAIILSEPGHKDTHAQEESPGHQCQLTPEAVDEAVDAIFRDHGPFGRHSKRCVYLDDEQGITRWCCADDCEIANKVRQDGK